MSKQLTITAVSASRYESQVDASDMICPYCHHAYEPESGDYSVFSGVHACSECGKKYHAVQLFSVDHKSTPDCELNDEQHQWVSRSTGGGKTHPFCAVCDQASK